MKIIDATDFEKMERRFRATFFNSLNGFKSVNLIGTINPFGQTNLAIFNSLFHLGANPPLIGLVVRPHTVERHTLENIIAVKEFTINQISEDFYRNAHQTAANYPKDVSEFDECGLTAEYHESCQAPFVGESRVKFALDFIEQKPIELNNTSIIIGQIKAVLIADNLISEDGFVNLEKAGTITCSGLDAYYAVKKIARLSYAKPETLPQFIR
jgi:flavin reductase (DIM6/NTAB) family NADH-FMN oxidoreductase RutF